MNADKTPALELDLNPFNLTHTKEGSHKLGYLYPVMCLECVPNDRINVKHSQFSRFSPLVYPIESKLQCKFYDFWVPTRLLYKYWKQFIADSTLDEHVDKYPLPAVRISDVAAAFAEEVTLESGEIITDCYRSEYFGPGSLFDWLGFPFAQFFSGRTVYANGTVYHINDKINLSTVKETINVLPFVAYQLIKNRWFRDENLEDDMFSEDEDIGYNYNGFVINLRSMVINWKAGLLEFPPDAEEAKEVCRQLFGLRKKEWERDYFTSALPSPQYGEPVPVPIQGKTEFNPSSDVDGTRVVITQSGNPVPLSQFPYSLSSVNVGSDGTMTGTFIVDGEDRTYSLSFDSTGIENVKNLNFTINDLRQASAVQRYQETLMRIGHRYDEYILGMFNQVVPDSYLDEPLLLNTESSPVMITDIAQTAVSTEQPLGSLAGNAYSKTDSDDYTYHCEEFGFLITLCAMLPRTSYMNGLPIMFSRQNRLDYYNPLFQEIGDQAIKNRQLFLGQNVDINDRTFGYIPRFQEYKEAFNTIHGDFTGNMSFMTLGRNFSQLPNLNKTFLETDQETLNRAFAETDNIDHVYSVFQNTVFSVRPMKVNPMPKLL